MISPLIFSSGKCVLHTNEFKSHVLKLRTKCSEEIVVAWS